MRASNWPLSVTSPPPSGLHEFGYYELQPTEAGRSVFPGALHVTQAHFHTFDIPAGAEHLATSALYPNQAFRYGDKTYAFQVHSEVTIEGFRRWQAAPWAAYGKPGAQSREEQDRLMKTFFPQRTRIVLDQFSALGIYPRNANSSNAE